MHVVSYSQVWGLHKDEYQMVGIVRTLERLLTIVLCSQVRRECSLWNIEGEGRFLPGIMVLTVAETGKLGPQWPWAHLLGRQPPESLKCYPQGCWFTTLVRIFG